MRPQEQKLLKHKLKELGEAYQDYVEDTDPGSRSYHQSCIDDITADILDFVENEIGDAVRDAVAVERANHD